MGIAVGVERSLWHPEARCRLPKEQRDGVFLLSPRDTKIRGAAIALVGFSFARAIDCSSVHDDGECAVP